MVNSSIRTDKTWDVIVIGTGIGGATLGYTLAQSGKEVLFLEKGQSFLDEAEANKGDYAEMFFPRVTVPDERHRKILEKSGRWTDYLEDSSFKKNMRHIPFLGSGSGGSSALYGAVMERFFPEDFTPKSCYPNKAGSNLPDAWPIKYEDLAPFYSKAENLYGVRGSRDPLRLDDEGTAAIPPPAMGPANRGLSTFLNKKGIHTYQLPIACEFVPGCQTCQGFLCPNNCKNDSMRVCLNPAINKHGAKLLDRCKVVRLEADASRVTSVICNRVNETFKLKGTKIILAAGALATPVILLRSSSKQWPSGLANQSGLVGRNLMRHCIDLYAVWPAVKPTHEENTKELAFNDYYFHKGIKYGSVQSFGRLPPAPMLTESLRHDLREQMGLFVSTLFGLIKPVTNTMFKRLFGNALVLATTMEDLPYLENRVIPVNNEGINIHYRLDESTKIRIDQFRQLMSETLKPLPYKLIKQAENNNRIAHACGTCRFGEDRATSVLDPFNRAHDLENLYVVDGSFFPSSAGTNPSLTIAANALRIAPNIIMA